MRRWHCFELIKSDLVAEWKRLREDSSPWKSTIMSSLRRFDRLLWNRFFSICRRIYSYYIWWNILNGRGRINNKFAKAGNPFMYGQGKMTKLALWQDSTRTLFMRDSLENKQNQIHKNSLRKETLLSITCDQFCQNQQYSNLLLF